MDQLFMINWLRHLAFEHENTVNASAVRTAPVHTVDKSYHKYRDLLMVVWTFDSQVLTEGFAAISMNELFSYLTRFLKTIMKQQYLRESLPS